MRLLNISTGEIYASWITVSKDLCDKHQECDNCPIYKYLPYEYYNIKGTCSNLLTFSEIPSDVRRSFLRCLNLQEIPEDASTIYIGYAGSDVHMYPRYTCDDREVYEMHVLPREVSFEEFQNYSAEQKNEFLAGTLYSVSAKHTEQLALAGGTRAHLTQSGFTRHTTEISVGSVVEVCKAQSECSTCPFFNNERETCGFEGAPLAWNI